MNPPEILTKANKWIESNAPILMTIAFDGFKKKGIGALFIETDPVDFQPKSDIYLGLNEFVNVVFRESFTTLLKNASATVPSLRRRDVQIVQITTPYERTEYQYLSICHKNSNIPKFFYFIIADTNNYHVVKYFVDTMSKDGRTSNCNPMDIIRIGSILKEFYQNKKKIWAKTTSPYNEQRGLIHGYELKRPFTQEELSELNIPQDLEYYLLNISCEFFVSRYPAEISYESSSKSTFEPKGQCALERSSKSTFEPKGNIVRYDDIPCPDHGDTDNCPNDCESWGTGTARIGDNGSAFHDNIVIKGNRIGTVWSCDSECMHLSHESLIHYLLDDYLKSQKYD